MIILVILIIVFSECCDNNIPIIIDFIIFFLIILRMLHLLFINQYTPINYISENNIDIIIIDTDNIQ